MLCPRSEREWRSFGSGRGVSGAPIAGVACSRRAGQQQVRHPLCSLNTLNVMPGPEHWRARSHAATRRWPASVSSQHVVPMRETCAFMSFAHGPARTGRMQMGSLPAAGAAAMTGRRAGDAASLPSYTRASSGGACCAHAGHAHAVKGILITPSSSACRGSVV